MLFFFKKKKKGKERKEEEGEQKRRSFGRPPHWRSEKYAHQYEQIKPCMQIKREHKKNLSDF